MGLKHFHRHSAEVIRTRRWQALRLLAKRRDGFQCVQCGAHGRLEVDHIKPVRTHPELSFDLANLQCLCPSCHSAKTIEECGLGKVIPARAAWKSLVRETHQSSQKHKDNPNA